MLAAVELVEGTLGEVAGVDASFMTTEEKREALAALHRARDRVDALYLSLLAASGDVAEEDGARDAGAWVASRLRVDRLAAAAALRLAEGLDRRWRVLALDAEDGVIWEEVENLMMTSYRHFALKRMLKGRAASRGSAAGDPRK